MALHARRRPVVSGQEDMQGAVGRLLEFDQNGEPWAEVRGERWKVRVTNRPGDTASQGLRPGQRVRVLATRGLTLDVQPLDDVGDGDGP